jgi:hypothetical protein
VSSCTSGRRVPGWPPYGCRREPAAQQLSHRIAPTGPKAQCVVGRLRRGRCCDGSRGSRAGAAPTTSPPAGALAGPAASCMPASDGCSSTPSAKRHRVPSERSATGPPTGRHQAVTVEAVERVDRALGGEVRTGHGLSLCSPACRLRFQCGCWVPDRPTSASTAPPKHLAQRPPTHRTGRSGP